MTTIYLMRHSKCQSLNNSLSKDSFQIKNEKRVLSVEGENIALISSQSPELFNIDAIYSSNYTRAIATSKYIADRNNLTINVLDELGERKYGVLNDDEIPKGYHRKEMFDENYKLGNGECQKEVRQRMYDALMGIIKDNKDKRVVIVSHGTCISFLLKCWCNIEFTDDKFKYSYNDKVLLHNYLDYCETFKLEFDDNNNLVDINNIKVHD